MSTWAIASDRRYDRDFTIDEAAPPTVRAAAAILLFAGVFNSFDFMTTGREEFSVNLQLLLRLAICGACGLFGLFHLRESFQQLTRFPLAWAAMFGLWSLLTLGVAQSPIYVAAALGCLWCMLLFIPAALHVLGGRTAALALLAGLTCFALGAWFLYLFVPSIGRQDFIVGDFETTRFGHSPQELALQLAWLLALSLLLVGKGVISRRVAILPLALALVTLPLTQSRTAMLTAALAAIVVLWRMIGSRVAALLACSGVALTAAVLLAIFATDGVEFRSDQVLKKFTRSGRLSEIYTFTGRTEIWQFTLHKIGREPILGYGYGASRFALSDAYEVSGYNENELHHAHNLPLNIVLTTGVIGGLLLAPTLLSLVWNFFRRPNAFPDMVLALTFVAGMTEPMLFGPMPRSHVLFFLIALCWRQMNLTLEKDDAEEGSLDVAPADPLRARQFPTEAPA